MPTVREICSALNIASDKFIAFSNGAPDSIVDHPSNLEHSSDGSVTFLGKSRYDKDPEIIKKIKAALLVLDETAPIDHAELEGTGVHATILSQTPRYDFIRIVTAFFSANAPCGIHPTAVLGTNCTVGQDVFIGPYSVIGDDCSIGDGSIIYSGVHIYSKVRIGQNVRINSGSVIGADGFGYHRIESGELIKFPHLGGVIIEDDVEIGANTCIDRGTLGDTIIGKGSKIDNLVHIAHNVVIGENSVVIAHAMIAGSARVGPRSWIAPCASVMDGIKIGADTFVGMGAVVLKTLPEEVAVFGNPARTIRTNQKSSIKSSEESVYAQKK